MYRNDEDSNKLSDIFANPIGMIIGIGILIYGLATDKYFLLSLSALYLVFSLISAFFKMLGKQQLKKMDDPAFEQKVTTIINKILVKHDYSTIADDEIKQQLRALGIKDKEAQNEIIYNARIANVSKIDSNKFR